MNLAFLPPLLVFLSTLAAITPATGAEITTRQWKLDSFRDFAQGRFEDSGVNDYAAADGTLRLINAFDFNRDGRPDAFFPSTHAHNEKADLSIYWNDHGYSAQKRTWLPTEGGRDAAVADLNRDGFPDLVVVNSFDGTRTDLNSYIYWGSSEGYSPDRRTLLPTQGAEAVAIGDLDGNGWPDIAFANNGRGYHVAVDKTQQSYIYWNFNGSFSRENKTILPSINARDVAFADLNGDGALDVVLVSAGNSADEAGARIFWSAKGKFDPARSTFLPGDGSSAVAIGDLNGDGLPDLALCNATRLKRRDANIYDIVDTVFLDSFVYWNSPKGFEATRRLALPTVAASDVAIGDLDQDGFQDLIFANNQGGASFVYWGSKSGFEARHRLALPTKSAKSVISVDLDGDGFIDLAFANSSEQSLFDIDSYIYWGGPGGPSADRRQALPTSGATSVVAAQLRPDTAPALIFLNKQSGRDGDTPSTLYLSDVNRPSVFDPAKGFDLETDGPNSFSAVDLNQDGWPELLVPCDEALFAYWSDKGTFKKTSRTALSTGASFSSRLADFNRDGYLDLMLSEWIPGSTTTRVRYGEPGGFSAAQATTLPVKDVRFHALGDFNNDGWVDVAFPLVGEEKVIIFWNSPQGFNPEKRTDLPVRATVSVETADLNGDGFLDLIVPNLFDQHPASATSGATGQSFGGSPDGGVFLFWGSAKGYSPERRTILPAIGAEDVAVADLNNDGRLDLVVTSYHGGVKRNFPSYVYWQDARGFDASHVTLLETNSASGALTTDFNADGWIDILISNHQANGNHVNDSYLYWGSAAGFSPERRLLLPAQGPHLMTVTDPGEIHDRRHRYSYVSPAKKFPGALRLKAAEWQADTPPGTDVDVQFRSATSEQGLAKAEWVGASGPDSTLPASARTLNVPLQGSWCQFRVILKNPGGGLPVFRSLNLQFE